MWFAGPGEGGEGEEGWEVAVKEDKREPSTEIVRTLFYFWLNVLSLQILFQTGSHFWSPREEKKKAKNNKKGLEMLIFLPYVSRVSQLP